MNIMIYFALRESALNNQTTEPAFEATLGQISAHSFATGPVI